MLAEYLDDDDISCADNKIQLIVSYFGAVSIYNKRLKNAGDILCEEMSIDNVGLFKAVLMINKKNIL